jgi:hypothetical protein
MFGIFPYTGLTLNRTYSSDLQFKYLKCPLNMTTSKWDRMGDITKCMPVYGCVWQWVYRYTMIYEYPQFMAIKNHDDQWIQGYRVPHFPTSQTRHIEICM